MTPLIDDETGFSGAVAVNRDVSDSLRQQRALAEKRAFAEALLDALPGRTCVVGDDGLVRAVNARYEHQGPFGDGPGSGPGPGSDLRAFLELCAPTTAGAGVLLDALRTTFADGRGSAAIDVPGAGDHWTSAQVSPFSGAGGGALVSFLDVSERKQHELELAHQATHDALTDLPNRALMLDRLHEGLARAHRRGDLLAVLFVDLDELKAINDSQGHQAGDVAIRAAAARLSLACRSCDTVARVGGDEFVVVLEELHSPAEAEELSARMLASLAATEHPEHTSAGSWPRAISASVGVVMTDVVAAPRTHDAADLVRRADIAMLAAKRSGKGRIVAEGALGDQGAATDVG